MRTRVLGSVIFMAVTCGGVCNNLHAQDHQQVKYDLTGTVVDSSTGHPLVGATVQLTDLRRGTATDVHGRFHMEEVERGRHHIIVRLIGYTELRDSIHVQRNTELRFALRPAAVELSGVTVTREVDHTGLLGTTRSLTVLSPSDLDRHRGQTLGQTLEKVPGVTLMQTGPSISKPVVRGLHSQRVLILNAGVPQEGQQWGGEHAPEIDPFAVSRIEVLRGASAVAYGPGAIGGVITIEPRQLRHNPGLDGELLINGFSNNLQGSGALTVEGSPGFAPEFAWRVQGSARKAGDARAARYVIGNSGFHELNGSLAFGYTTDPASIEVYYSHFSTTLGIYSGSHIGNLTDLRRAIEAGQPLTEYSFTYDVKPPKQEISHDLVSIRSSVGLASLGELDVMFGYQQNHREEFDAHKLFASSPGELERPTFQLTLTTYNADVKLKHHLGGQVYGTFGLSGMRQGNVRAGTIFLIPNFRAYSAGAYLLESAYFDEWTFTAGVRYDYRWMRVYPLPAKGIVERIHEYQSISGAAGFVYQIHPGWSVAANIGTAWRPPSVNELYSNDLHHGTAQYEIGNINLSSERSVGLDATLRHSVERVKLELSVFNNWMDNFIFLFPDTNPTLTIRGAFPTFRYAQSHAVINGIEGTLELEVTDSYRFTVSGSLVRGRNVARNEPLIQMPADRVRLLNHFHVDGIGLLQRPYLELAVSLVRRQHRVPLHVDYAEPPPGYGLIDLALGSELHLGTQSMHVDLSVQNLFNKRYRDYLSRFRYFVDDPGRNIVLRVRIPFGAFDTHE